jgi:U3 small nucleolar RNA-associated protein 18
MLRRMRNANQANPTTGKKEAEGAGGGVVDFTWHPNPKVGVMAVAGGDRRVRFFNVSGRILRLLVLVPESLPSSLGVDLRES